MKAYVIMEGIIEKIGRWVFKQNTHDILMDEIRELREEVEELRRQLAEFQDEVRENLYYYADVVPFTNEALKPWTGPLITKEDVDRAARFLEDPKGYIKEAIRSRPELIEIVVGLTVYLTVIGLIGFIALLLLSIP